MHNRVIENLSWLVQTKTGLSLGDLLSLHTEMCSLLQQTQKGFFPLTPPQELSISNECSWAHSDHTTRQMWAFPHSLGILRFCSRLAWEMTPSFKSQQEKVATLLNLQRTGSRVPVCLAGTVHYRKFSTASLCQGVLLGVKCNMLLFSTPAQESFFSGEQLQGATKKILQINYCYCSHKEQKYKFLWLYCADSCAVPERFFQQQERRTDSLHKAIKADNPQEVIMWIPRRETKIEQRIIQPAIRISILPLSWRGWFILLMPGK